MHGDNLGSMLSLQLACRQTDGTQLCSKVNGRWIVILHYKFRFPCQFKSQLCLGSVFTAAYQGYSCVSTTHSDRKHLVIFIATFEQLLTQMMGSRAETASLSHMVVQLRILFH